MTNLERLQQEILELRKCCSQRGARLQIMRDILISEIGLSVFDSDFYPEVERWFHKDGTPRGGVDDKP